MSITLDQIIQDAKRVANRFKDLEALGNALLVEAEGNNRQIETMKQFQDDIDSLNKLARNKTNVEMVNRVNQQNPSLREFRQENRELKATLEDHQRALELIMHKYREHVQHTIFKNRINFKEMYNAKLQDVIRKQQDKINEMVAVMQKAASVDDDIINNEIELITRLKIENQGLREMLQISKQFGTSRIGCEDKSIQTEFLLSGDDHFDSYKIINDNDDDNDNNKSKIEKNYNEIQFSKDTPSPPPSQMQYENNEIIENAIMMTKSTETIKIPSSSSLITQQNAAITTTTKMISPSSTTLSKSTETTTATTTDDNNKSEINLENAPKNKSSIAETTITKTTTTTPSPTSEKSATTVVESIKTIEDSVNVPTKSLTPTSSSSSTSTTSSLVLSSEINSLPIMNGECSGDCESSAQEQVS